MKHFYKITFFCCAATLWMLVLASCEGGELYDVNAPEWISDKIQEIEDSKKEPEDEYLKVCRKMYTPSGIRISPPVSGLLFPSIMWYLTVRNGMQYSILTSTLSIIHITRTLPLSSPMMWIVTVKNIPNTELSALMLQIALKLITLSGAIILTSSTYRTPCFLIPLITKTRTYKS